jgi:DNA polymerase III sliding clamp (beta) subunit (PCNA family)
MNELYKNLQPNNQQLPTSNFQLTGGAGKELYSNVSLITDALKNAGINVPNIQPNKSEELLQKPITSQIWNLLLSGATLGLAGSIPDPETAKKSGNLLYQELDIPVINWLYKNLISPYGISIAGLAEGGIFATLAGKIGKIGGAITKTALGLGGKTLEKVGAKEIVNTLSREFYNLSPGKREIARKMAEQSFVLSLLGAGNLAKQQYWQTGQTPSLGERLKNVALEYLNPFTYVGAGIFTGLDVMLGGVLAGRATKQLEGVLGREIPLSERIRNFIDTGNYVESSIPKINEIIKATPVNDFTYRSLYETLKKEPIIYSNNIKPALDALKLSLPEKTLSQLDFKIDNLKSFFDEVLPELPLKDLVRYSVFEKGGISKIVDFIDKIADPSEQRLLRANFSQLADSANKILDNTAKMFNLVLENSKKFNFEGINIDRLKEIFNKSKLEITQRQIETQKTQLDSLNNQLKETTDVNEKKLILKEINAVKEEIARLNKEGVVNYAVVDNIPLVQKQMILNAILSNPVVVGKALKGTQFEMLLKERLDLLNEFDSLAESFSSDFLRILPRYDSNAFIKLISDYKNNPRNIFGERSPGFPATSDEFHPYLKDLPPEEKDKFLRFINGKLDEATISGEIKSKPTEVPEAINQAGDVVNTAVGGVNEIIGNASKETKESFKNVLVVFDNLDKIATTPEKKVVADKIKDIVNKKIENTGFNLRPEVAERIKNIYDPIGERTITNNTDIQNIDNLISNAGKQAKLGRIFEFLSYGDVGKYDIDTMTSALLRILTNSDEHLKFVSKLLDDSVDKTDIYKFVHGEIIKGLGNEIKKDSPSTYLSVKGKYSTDKYGELINYFKSKAMPFKSAEKSVGELTMDKSFLDEVSKSLNEEPTTPEMGQVKPEVKPEVKSEIKPEVSTPVETTEATKELKPLTEKIKPKTAPPKEETKSKKEPKVNETSIVKKLISDNYLESLKNVLVKDGKMMATNLDVFLVKKTSLKDGFYEPIGNEYALIKNTNLLPEDFPKPLEFKPENKVASLSTKELQKIIKTASDFVSDNNLAMGGVLVRMRDGKAEIVSTDSSRLYLKTISINNNKNDIEFIMDRPDIIKDLLKILSNESDLFYDKERNFVVFKDKNGDMVYVKTIDDKFPDFEPAYPVFSNQYVVDNKTLTEALKKIEPFVDKKTGYFNVIFDKNKIKLSAESEKFGKNEVVVPVLKQSKINDGGQKVDGILVAPILNKREGFGFNIDYLKSAVKNLDGKNVFISLTDNKEKPIHFYDRNFVDELNKTGSRVDNIVESKITNPEQEAKQTTNYSTEKEKIINDFYQKKYNEVVRNLKSKFSGNIEQGQIADADIEDAISEVITGIINGDYPIKDNISGLIYKSASNRILNKLKANNGKISLEKQIGEDLTLGDIIASPEKSEFDLKDFVDKFLVGLKNLEGYTTAEKKEILDDFEKLLKEASRGDLVFDKKRNIEILGENKYNRLLKVYDLIFNTKPKK